MYMYVDACVLCIFVTASVSMSLSMKQIIHVNMRATRMCTCERMHLATRVPQSAFCSKMYRIRMSEYEDVCFPTCSSIPKPNMIPAVQKTNSICFFTTNLCLTHRPLRHHVLGSLHISPRQGSTWTLLSKDLCMVLCAACYEDGHYWRQKFLANLECVAFKKPMSIRLNTQAQNYAGGLIAGTWHKLTNEDKRTGVEPQLSSAGTDMRSSCSLSFHMLMFECFSSSNNLKSPYPLKYSIISQYDAFTRSIKRITAIAVGHQHQDSTKLPPAYQQYYWPFYLLLSWMKTTHPKLTA